MSVLVLVDWETDGEPAPTANPVAIPSDVYDAGMTSWDDVVADYLSCTYGYLVTGWVRATIVVHNAAHDEC